MSVVNKKKKNSISTGIHGYQINHKKDILDTLKDPRNMHLNISQSSQQTQQKKDKKLRSISQSIPNTHRQNTPKSLKNINIT